MAEFRAAVDDLVRVQVPQADVSVDEDGFLDLDSVSDGLRPVVEAELRLVPSVEEIVDDPEDEE